MDQKNLIYAATQSKYQIMMHWWLTLKDFELNIQHISGVENIVADTISRFLSTTFDLDESKTTRDLSKANGLFTTRAEQSVGDGYPLDLALVQREQKNI